MLRRLVTGLLVACVLAVVPAAAQAAGQIGFGGCVANDTANGCTDLPGAPLHQTDVALATSPSSDLYAIGHSGVLHFRAAPQGQITFGGCVANDTADGCTDLPGDPLRGARELAVSPNGESVYAIAINSGSVGHFFRAPEGQIFWRGCVANDSADGCTDLPAAPLWGASGVAVSPDGAVYATGGLSQSIAHFSTLPQGGLVFGGCAASNADQGCTVLGGSPLGIPLDLATSPDGKSVYVVGGRTIARFDRLSGGQLTYQGCFGNDASFGCADLPFDPLRGAGAVAVSPKGDSVYVASAHSGSIAHFFRGANGALTYDGCVANGSADGCADLPAAPLNNPQNVAVSPDGKSVYASALSGGGVGHFFRAAQGQITWDGCLNNDGSQGCRDLPGSPLNRAFGIAVSPNGNSVYIGGSGTVSHFFRATGGEPPPGSVKTPGGQPGGGVGTPGAQSCFGKRATIVGTPRGDRISGTRRADVIVALGGNDRVSGGGGNDLICASGGNDSASGGGGNDRLDGGSGNDGLKGDAGKDTLVGGAGKDGLKGGGQRDRCVGGSARDRASGCERTSSL